jgi:hypothetical protein
MLGQENKENFLGTNKIIYDKSQSVVMTPNNNHTIKKKLLTNENLDNPQYRNSQAIAMPSKPKPIQIEDRNSIE